MVRTVMTGGALDGKSFTFTQEQIERLEKVNLTPPTGSGEPHKHAKVVTQAVNYMITHRGMAKQEIQSSHVLKVLTELNLMSGFPRAGGDDDKGTRRTIADTLTHLKVDRTRKGGKGGNKYRLPESPLDAAWFTAKGITLPE